MSSRRVPWLRAFLLGAVAAIVMGGIVFAITSFALEGRRGPRRWAEKRLQALKPFLMENAIAGELGVLKGDLSQEILDSLKPAKLHLVDPWYLQGPEWPWEKGDRSTIHALAGILKDFQEELTKGQVVLDIGYDQDVLAALPDGYFDWAYLDTTHEYAQTRTELQLLQRKVKASGVIAGDDWRPNPTHPHHGVYKALQELIAEGRYEILYSNSENLQWAIRRKTYAASNNADRLARK
jgi:hypothetical protein